jgi:hypothetical protein
VDAYRLRSADDTADIGLDEVFSDGRGDRRHRVARADRCRASR